MIDAQLHFWRYQPPGPAWMAEGMEGLRRDFLVEDLDALASNAGVTGAIRLAPRSSGFYLYAMARHRPRMDCRSNLDGAGMDSFANSPRSIRIK